MELKIKFFDVGHGSSVLIENDEINIIFDLGSNSENSFNPFPSLNEKLDYLIITHPHMDHISSLKYMYDNYEPTTLLVNQKIPNKLIDNLISNTETEEDANIYKKYNDLNIRYIIPVPDYMNPTFPENNGGIKISSFLPQK